MWHFVIGVVVGVLVTVAIVAWWISGLRFYR
jgi:hypothetical protein